MCLKRVVLRCVLAGLGVFGVFSLPLPSFTCKGGTAQNARAVVCLSRTLSQGMVAPGRAATDEKSQDRNYGTFLEIWL